MIFKEYKSKPIVRKAYEIKDHDRVYYYPADSKASIGGYYFECYKRPKAGDYVVHLNETDIYHCSKEVFEERNHV